MGFLRRQAIIAALTANAVRPIRNQQIGALSFMPGWLTSELAPHLAALTAVDAVTHLASKKPGKRVALGLSAASLAGFAWMIRSSRRTGAEVESALVAGIGEEYAAGFDQPVTAAELATPWRRLVNPFDFRNPRVRVERNIRYTDHGFRGMLDIYLPADRELKNAPVLLQVHGGGWILSKKTDQAIAMMQRMAEKGWVVVSCNYRLAPKHPWPAQIEDVKQAIAWVKEHISEYGGDPDYLAITGGSAGGHLSSLAALTPNDPRFQPGFEDVDTTIDACVPFYGVYDMAGITGLDTVIGMRDGFLAPTVMKKRYADHPEVFEAASPMHHIGRTAPDLPDFFVLHGTNDTLVDIEPTRAFVQRLKETSTNTVTYAEITGAQHAFDVFPSIRSEHVIRAVERWLTWHRMTWLQRRRSESAA